jgi:hypothetical protein
MSSIAVEGAERISANSVTIGVGFDFLVEAATFADCPDCRGGCSLATHTVHAQ